MKTPLKTAFLGLMLLLMAPAQAQVGPAFSSGFKVGHGDVTARIKQAKKQILLYAPSFSALESSEALRLTSNRGVKVFVITTLETLNAKDSLLGLRLFAPNTKIYTVKLTKKNTMPFVVLDNQEVLLGDAVVSEGSLLSPSEATITHEAKVVHSHVNWFSNVVNNTSPVNPRAYLKKYGLH